MTDPQDVVHEMLSIVKFKFESDDKLEEIEISLQQVF